VIYATRITVESRHPGRNDADSRLWGWDLRHLPIVLCRIRWIGRSLTWSSGCPAPRVLADERITVDLVIWNEDDSVIDRNCTKPSWALCGKFEAVMVDKPVACFCAGVGTDCRETACFQPCACRVVDDPGRSGAGGAGGVSRLPMEILKPVRRRGKRRGGNAQV